MRARERVRPVAREPDSIALGRERLRQDLAQVKRLGDIVVGAHGEAQAVAERLPFVQDMIMADTLEGRQKIESAVAAHLRAIKEKRDGRAEARTLYRLLLEPVALADEVRHHREHDHAGGDEVERGLEAGKVSRTARRSRETRPSQKTCRPRSDVDASR